MFRDAAGTRELNETDVLSCGVDKGSHLGSLAVDHVQVGRFQSRMDQQPDELLQYDTDFRFGFDQWAVSHGKCTDELQGGNLKWKIERCDDDDGSVRPAVAPRFLAIVITRVGKAARKKANAVSGKVFQEHARNRHFAQALVPALRHDALYETGEIAFDNRVCEQCGRASTNLSEIYVTVRILQRIVQARLRAAPEPLDVGREIRRVRLFDEDVTVHRVDNVVVVTAAGNPRSTNQIIQNSGICCRHAIEGIDGGKLRHLGHAVLLVTVRAGTVRAGKRTAYQCLCRMITFNRMNLRHSHCVRRSER